ncbi:pyrroline-5-carboxylate reductase [Candidatus Omnitrophota bacterium]
MRKIAFIGCGNMGQAILKGLLARKIINKSGILVSDAKISKLTAVKKKFGVSITRSNIDCATKSQIIVLAIKPQEMKTVLSELKPYFSEKLIISIAAGVTIDFIKKHSGSSKVIRVMPNLPAIVGKGISAISASRGVSKPNLKIASSIFESVGDVISLDEKYINAVTAISGSGPAYFFMLMENMIEAGISAGLKKDIALKLVIKTALGSASLQQELGVSPKLLREQVTSKKGTTEAALKILKKRGFDRAVKAGVNQAIKRAKELSK